jgi:hypothetical protein
MQKQQKENADINRTRQHRDHLKQIEYIDQYIYTPYIEYELFILFKKSSLTLKQEKIVGGC